MQYDMNDGTETNVFVALHPFLDIPMKSPKRHFGGPFAVSPYGKVIGQAPASVRMNPIRSVLSVTELERTQRLAIGELTKTASRRISWETIRRGCDFSTLADIQQALYSIAEPPESQNLSERVLSVLIDYCDRNSIFLPSHGFVPPSLEPAIGKVLICMGESEVLISDEFEIQQVRARAADFVAQGSVVLGLPLSIRGTVAAAKLTTPDERFTCEAQEGAFFTLICTRIPQAIEIISDNFDGFWCDPSLSKTWWLSSV